MFLDNFIIESRTLARAKFFSIEETFYTNCAIAATKNRF